MNVYWLVAILTLVLNRILPCRTDKAYLINLLISFLPLFIYAAIRVDYGNDYPAYEQYFELFHTGHYFSSDVTHHAEIGYQYLNYILPSYRAVLILSASMLFCSLVFFLYKNVPSKYTFVAILLIFMMPEKNIFGILVGIRNGLVVSAFLLTFTFIQERRIIATLVTAYLLSLIHTSAIAYVPFAYIIARNTPITRKELYIWIVAAIVLGISSMSSIIDLIVPFFTLFADRYEQALQNLADGYSRGLLNLFANLVMMIAFLSFGYYHRNELSTKQNALLRMAALYCISGMLGAISGRMTIFYGVSYACGIALMCSFRWKYQELKYILLIFSILINIYAICVWQSAVWWNHGTYYSIFD
jgi:hypothetical protein